VTIFISYSQDVERVRRLVQALRRHGLRTWRDQDSLEQGAATEVAIEAELEQCDTAMIWLGGNTLNSEFVCRNELPLIFQHHAARGLRIVPLFVDVDVADGVQALRAATGHEVGSHNGYHFGHAKSLDEHLAEVANREVRATLYQRAQAPGSGRPTVRCVTRSDAAGGRDEADLNLDWIPEYPADGTLPEIATVEALQAALHVSSQHLIASFGAGTVDLFLKSHLHFAVAIGFELRRVTGLYPRVDVEGTWWDVDVAPALGEDEQLIQRVTNGPAGGSRTAIEISLTRDVGPMVNDYVTTTDTAYRRRVELVPTGGPNQQSVTTTTVNAWAEQAADAIRALRALPGVDTTDVFMAAPIGFAVALGWRLNAIGGIQLFHPHGNTGPYVHVWTVPRS
jgi:hypothetical protein